MGINNFDIRLLRVFDALMVEGNVTRAAQRLHLTQSATSQALAKLRDAFGDPLFVRSGQAMKPTAKAVAMAQPIRQALETMWSALEGSLVFDPARSRRSFRIASTDYLSTILLPRLAARVAQGAPGTRLITTSVSPDRGLDYIRDGRIDLLIAYFVVTKVPGNFRTRQLFKDSYVVLTRKGDRRFRHGLTLEGFSEADHVVVAPRENWLPGPTDVALGKRGLKRRIRVMVPHYMVVPHIVAETDLIATVPASAAERMGSGLPIKVFPLPLEVAAFNVEMTWDERHHHDPAHKWLRSAVTAVSKTVHPR